MQTVFSLLYNDHEAYKKCVSLWPTSDRVSTKVITERALSKGLQSFGADTDLDRIYHLQQNPDWWYLDCDLFIHKWPDFELEPGFIYVGNTCGDVDLWAILGNGCKDIFDYLMNYYNARNGDVPFVWAHKLLSNELKDRVRFIPNGYFTHLSFSGAVVSAEQTGQMIGGYGYSLQYKNGNWDVKISIPKIENKSGS